MSDNDPGSPRIAIYARFSSRLQKPTSIRDQVRMCADRVRDLGGVLVRVHADPAATGATRDTRPALRELLLDAERGRIDIVLAEALDRLSRDQEHIAGIHKQLRYWNVRLITLEEGEIEPIHVAIGGLMSQTYIENLAARTRRGQIGAVHDGRVPTGLSYGYRIANEMDDRGRVTRGLREIDPEQAAVVRRIFELYADGASARSIAALLNREGVPSPRANGWTWTTINGNPAARKGILNNDLYAGRLIYGRQTFVRDPRTGKRQPRPVPPSEWTIAEVPELRIVDEHLWRRVQDRRQAGHDRRFGSAPRIPHPLTGILRCGVCGGRMTVANKRRYRCHNRHSKGTCSNPRGIGIERIENEACSLLALLLLRTGDVPDLVREAADAARRRRGEIERAIDDGRRRVALLLDAIETGSQSTAAHRRIVEIEREEAALRVEADSLPDLPHATPEDLSRRLQQRLGVLAREISGSSPERRRHALLRLAGLIERIDILPLPGRGNVDISIDPATHRLVAFALDDAPPLDFPDACP